MRFLTVSKGEPCLSPQPELPGQECGSGCLHASRLEVDLPPHHEYVTRAVGVSVENRDVAILYIRMDPVEHQAGSRVQVPVDSEREIVFLAAVDPFVGEIYGRESNCDFPGADASVLFVPVLVGFLAIPDAESLFEPSVIIGEVETGLGVPAIEVRVTALFGIHRVVEVLTGIPESVDDPGKLDIPDRGTFAREDAGVDKPSGQVVFGSGPESKIAQDRVDLAHLADVDGATEMEELSAIVAGKGSKPDATGSADSILGNAVAEVVGVVEDTYPPVEPVTASVDADTRVPAGRESLDRKRALHEGEILGAGQLFEAEELLEVSETDLPETELETDPDILEIGIPVGKVVLRLEHDPIVNRALEEDACTSEFEAVLKDIRPEGAGEIAVDAEKRVVGHNSAAKFQLESAALLDLVGVAPLRDPFVLLAVLVLGDRLGCRLVSDCSRILSLDSRGESSANERGSKARDNGLSKHLQSPWFGTGSSSPAGRSDVRSRVVR